MVGGKLSAPAQQQGIKVVIDKSFKGAIDDGCTSTWPENNQLMELTIRYHGEVPLNESDKFF